MTTLHYRTAGTVVFDGETPEPPVQQSNLIVANPATNCFLYRTRLWLEFRVWAWSPVDDETIFFNWYNSLFAIAGVEYIAADVVPDGSSNPLSDHDSATWVQWEALNGTLEQKFTSHGGNEFMTYRASLAGGISESFAKRKPGAFATQSLWLAWDWYENPEFINETHASFDPVFDLQVNYAVDSFWQLYPE